jgi:transposase-like protein
MSDHDDPRCDRLTKRGNPCRNAPMKGRTTCKPHSGDTNVGRRSALHDPNTRARLLLRLQTGCTIRDACASTGVHESTYYRWIEAGEADERADRASQEREFREQATQARAEARVVAVGVLQGAMRPFTRTTRRTRRLPDGTSHIEETTETVEPDWRAALAFLERTDPENWGRRDKLDVTAHDAPSGLAELTDQQLAEIERVMNLDDAV